MRKKSFILARQPHEAYSHIHAGGSPSRAQTLSFCMALIVLVGCLSSASPLEANYAAIRKGLERVALGTQICPLMPQSDAVALLKGWYGATVACTEPTERMWQSYCQQFYVSEGGDCSAATPENKAMIMNNMRVCKVLR